MLTADIHWMAGLLEGCGHFSCTGGNPALVVASSDLDTVEKAARVLKSTTRGPERRVGYRKDVWVTSVHGKDAAGWLMTLFRLFGRRRQTRIREVLAQWRKALPARERVLQRANR